jgi:protein-S-isoprenylcysteine O-methyltransferase Ste14
MEAIKVVNTGTVDGRRAVWWVVAQIPLLALTIVVPVAQVLLHVQGPWIGVLVIPARVVGVALTGLGVVVFRAAQRELGPALVATPMPVRDAVLRESGVYEGVRHPIYAAILSAVFGWALLWNSVVGLVLAAMCCFFFLAKSRYEESLLLQVFPGYEEYRRRVPRLVPHRGRLVRGRHVAEPDERE